MTGSTFGADHFPAQVFVHKLDAEGIPAWSRSFGARGDVGLGVTVDRHGNAYVAGATTSAFPGKTSAGGTDAFVRKYDANGREAWTRQFGTTDNDSATSVRADRGHVVVAGVIDHADPRTGVGPQKTFVRSLNENGTEMWARQFETGDDANFPSLAVGRDGSVLVAGTTGEMLPGQSSAGPPDAFLRKYDATGNEVWSREFGTPMADLAFGVGVDGRGAVSVGGFTYGVFPGQTSAGAVDGFVRTYDADGTELATQQFGAPMGGRTSPGGARWSGSPSGARTFTWRASWGARSPARSPPGALTRSLPRSPARHSSFLVPKTDRGFGALQSIGRWRKDMPITAARAS